MALESGDILTLFEFDDLTCKDANECMAFLMAIFPKTPIDWHLGNEPDLSPNLGWKYRNVIRAQWEAHKVNAPEVEGRDWTYFRSYDGAVNTGYIEDKYALCRITGAKRPITVEEHYEIFGGID